MQPLYIPLKQSYQISMQKLPLSNREKSTLFQLQVWLEYSFQIRGLAGSVTFLWNYNEVPLGIEVSLC